MHFDFVNIHNKIWIQKTFLILECDKRPSKLGITYYEQNSNNYWLTMVCALGTAFSPATCDCSMHLKINHVNDNPLGQPVSYRYNYLYLTAFQRWCYYNYTICVSRILYINSFFLFDSFFVSTLFTEIHVDEEIKTITVNITSLAFIFIFNEYWLRLLLFVPLQRIVWIYL